MITNKKVQLFLFFVVVAIVYIISKNNQIQFISDDVNNFFPRAGKYPLPFNDSKWHSQRLVDDFYGAVLFNFYYKFIYNTILAPIFGAQHFIDVYIKFGQIMWGLIFAGFALISICYVRLFVKLNIWLMAIYALLFYLIFVDSGNTPNYFNRLLAYNLSSLIGVCFLYPFVHYVTKKHDPFENWNETHAIAFMVVLSYLSYFTILFTVMFVSITLLSLLSLHIWTSYQRSDFQSVKTFWQKAKNEPKWVLVCAAVSPVFLLTYLSITLNSRRFDILIDHFDKAASSDKLQTFIKYFSSHYKHNYSYDNEQALFFVIIISTTLIFALIPKLKTREWKISKLTIKYTVTAASVIVVLTLISYSMAAVLIKYYYTIDGLAAVNFAFVTFILGLGFKLLQQKTIAPAIYLLFFVYCFSGIRVITAIKPPKILFNHPINSTVKEAVNLSYTFNCYGEGKTPFYNKLYTSSPYSSYSIWGQLLRAYADNQRDLAVWGVGKNGRRYPGVKFYYEPSIDKINAKLAELQKTKIWQCKRVKNDIYRIEQIDY